MAYSPYTDQHAHIDEYACAKTPVTTPAESRRDDSYSPPKFEELERALLPHEQQRHHLHYEQVYQGRWEYEEGFGNDDEWWATRKSRRARRQKQRERSAYEEGRAEMWKRRAQALERMMDDEKEAASTERASYSSYQLRDYSIELSNCAPHANEEEFPKKWIGPMPEYCQPQPSQEDSRREKQRYQNARAMCTRANCLPNIPSNHAKTLMFETFESEESEWVLLDFEDSA